MQVKGFILLRWNINVEFTFFDRSLVDRVRSNDPNYIRRCIRDEMYGTSVTVVLIGNNTYKSQWVGSEIEESVERGNGLLGIRLKGKSGVRVPEQLKDYGARVMNRNPHSFEDAIEMAAKETGR